MSGARRDPTAAANSAVTLMKQAVEAAIEHGDIKIEVVCKAVGMSRSQMQTWLASRAPSAQWDTKLAEWLKKVQTRAIEGATSSGRAERTLSDSFCEQRAQKLLGEALPVGQRRGCAKAAQLRGSHRRGEAYHGSRSRGRAGFDS